MIIFKLTWPLKNMCYDSEIFKNKIDENCFCPICRSVLCIDSMQVRNLSTWAALLASFN